MEDEIILIVEDKQITVQRSSIALVSKFFKALFTHEFLDSHKSVLHLDRGGEMGLTGDAVQVTAGDSCTDRPVAFNCRSSPSLLRRRR